MGKKKAETVYLETRWGIHTFFMKYPIDVFVLDDKDKVVKVKRNLKPWRVFFWNPRYYRVLETPVGKIKSPESNLTISFS